jgi:hypothetical protein
VNCSYWTILCFTLLNNRRYQRERRCVMWRNERLDYAASGHELHSRYRNQYRSEEAVSERSFLSWLSSYCPEGGSSSVRYLQAVFKIFSISAISG